MSGVVLSGVYHFLPTISRNILALCEKNGWQKPSYYRGAHNTVTRGMEAQLLPILRSHGIFLWAMRRSYFFRICCLPLGGAPEINQMKLRNRPFAAGFLTGKLVNNNHAGTRADDSNPLGKAIQAKFASGSLHTAMKLLMAQ